MSVADDYSAAHIGQGLEVWHLATTDKRPLHRVAEVRRQQGVSMRSICRKLKLSAEEVRHQENPATDLMLSQLCAWQQALDVPLQDLLIDLDAPLSSPVMSRAKLVRVMKTIRAIQESTREVGTQRLATVLIDLLIEAMPELREVTAWHSVGQRRTQDEMGRIAEEPISDSFARDGLR
jgi:transcriptional regulator with XRE-family HTH domain